MLCKQQTGLPRLLIQSALIDYAMCQLNKLKSKELAPELMLAQKARERQPGCHCFDGCKTEAAPRSSL